MSKKPADAPSTSDATHAPTDTAPSANVPATPPTEPAAATAPAPAPDAAQPPAAAPEPAPVPPPVAKSAPVKAAKPAPKPPYESLKLLGRAERLLEDIEAVMATARDGSDHLPVARDRAREIVALIGQRTRFLGTQPQA